MSPVPSEGLKSGRPSAVDDNERLLERLWDGARLLYQTRWWLVAIFVLSSIGSVWYALSLPNQYRAETRVLLPEGGGGLAAGLLGNIAPSAAALFGGGGSYTRYLAILTSRETLGAAVDQFNLVEVYDLSEELDPRLFAIYELGERSTFDVSLDYDYLSIQVLDPDPDRAAQISNFLVQHLNERHIELSSQSASENRALLESRLQQANLELDSAQAELQALQERYGVVEPDAQASAVMSALGTAQSQVAVAEAQYQSLLSQFGPENPDVVAAQAALSAAREQVARLQRGQEAVMPVPLQALPQVQRQYAEATQAIVTQARIIEEVQPLYEQARLQQQREASAVQVLDEAIPPPLKAEPRRSVLVVSMTISAVLLAMVCVVGVGTIQRLGPVVLSRLRSS
ncbi:MAG: Wzz/FepE/Etk N-terminal domain-containing protein [Bacteroidota bacterium]